MDNPISITAFYTCGIRMLDAERQEPVVGDAYAQCFMSDEAMGVLERFRKLDRANAGNLTRHRIIDDYLRGALQSDPNSCVVLLGAGFDTRAYRLQGGVWFEFDEPAIIAHKDARLPSRECANSLTRIPVRFGVDSLQDKLRAVPAGRRVIVVMEGVLLYLQPGQIDDAMRALRQVFPAHLLVCDLVTPLFIKRYSRRLHRVIRSLGTAFYYFAEEPEGFITRTGYRLALKFSVIEQAVQLGLMRIPRFVLRFLRGSLLEGYSVCVFDPTK